MLMSTRSSCRSGDPDLTDAKQDQTTGQLAFIHSSASSITKSNSNGVVQFAIPHHLPLPGMPLPYRCILFFFNGILCAHPQQRQAHESPVLFYSVALGSIGPVLAFTVPPIRERLGYRPPESIPTTYPRASPPFPTF